MNDEEHDKEDGTPADPAIGEIDLGRSPALGRRARLLAGLTTAAAAVLLLTPPDTGTVTHTGPLSPF